MLMLLEWQGFTQIIEEKYESPPPTYYFAVYTRGFYKEDGGYDSSRYSKVMRIQFRYQAFRNVPGVSNKVAYYEGEIE